MNQTLHESIGLRGFDRFRQGLEARFDANRLAYEIEYGDTPPNCSLRVRLESKDRISEIIAWESGDCDITRAEVGDEEPTTSHFSITKSDDFHEKLASIFRFTAHKDNED